MSGPAGTPPEAAPSPSPSLSPAATLGRALLVALVSFAVGEAATRTWLASADAETFLTYASPAQIHARPDLVASHFRFAPHRYLGYLPRPGFVRGELRHDARGFKDDELTVPKPAGEFRIVCLGGSTTYASPVDDPALAYPNRLEARLRAAGRTDVTVLNAGVDGWTSFEFLPQYLFRLRGLAPDLVIVHAGFNDTLNRLVWPPERFRSDNSGFRRPAIEGVHVPHVLLHSALVRVVGVRLGFLESGAELQTRYDRIDLDSVVADDLQIQLDSGRFPAPPFDSVTPERILAENDDRFAISNLAALVTLLQHDGVRVVLASEPMMAMPPAPPPPSDGENWQPWGVEPLPGFAPFVAEVRKFVGHVETLAAARGVPFLDLQARFPNDPSLFTDGLHCSRTGEDEKAARVGAFLESAGVLAPRGTP